MKNKTFLFFFVKSPIHRVFHRVHLCLDSIELPEVDKKFKDWKGFQQLEDSISLSWKEEPMFNLLVGHHLVLVGDLPILGDPC